MKAKLVLDIKSREMDYGRAPALLLKERDLESKSLSFPDLFLHLYNGERKSLYHIYVY